MSSVEGGGGGGLGWKLCLSRLTCDHYNGLFALRDTDTERLTDNETEKKTNRQSLRQRKWEGGGGVRERERDRDRDRDRERQRQRQTDRQTDGAGGKKGRENHFELCFSGYYRYMFPSPPRPDHERLTGC